MTQTDTRREEVTAARSPQVAVGAGGNRGSRERSRTVRLRGLVPLVAALAIWQATGGSQPNLPPPSQWWSALAVLNDNGTLLPAIGQSLESFAIALVTATVIGSVLGYLVGRSRRTDQALGPTLEFLRFTPSAAIVPVVVLLVGYVESTKIIVVVLGSVWPILLQTRQAARSLSAESQDLARSLRMGRWRRLAKVQLPLMLPSIVHGVRVASPVCLIMVLLVEITTAVPGIGRLIASAQQTFNTAAIFGLVILAAILSFLVNILIGLLADYVTRYRH
jgi:ABC-type nitrate/sulfonate/bicarbonate transport system permease component